MLVEEILIDGAFVAALMTAAACLVYLVYATILERHLLRTRRSPERANAANALSSVRTLSTTAASSAVAAPRDHWRGGPGARALPQGRG